MARKSAKQLGTLCGAVAANRVRIHQLSPVEAMTLSSRLALAMVLLAVVTACLVGAFTCYFLAAAAAPQGVAVAVGDAVLVGGAVAVLLAIVLAAGFAQSLYGPPLRMTGAAQALARGKLTPMPKQGVSEITVLATAFAGISAQLRARQGLLEHTVQSISDESW